MLRGLGVDLISRERLCAVGDRLRASYSLGRRRRCSSGIPILRIGPAEAAPTANWIGRSSDNRSARLSCGPDPPNRCPTRPQLNARWGSRGSFSKANTGSTTAVPAADAMAGAMGVRQPSSGSATRLRHDTSAVARRLQPQVGRAAPPDRGCMRCDVARSLGPRIAHSASECAMCADV